MVLERNVELVETIFSSPDLMFSVKLLFFQGRESVGQSSRQAGTSVCHDRFSDAGAVFSRLCCVCAAYLETFALFCAAGGHR